MADNKITVEIEIDDQGIAKGFKKIEEQGSRSFAEIAKGVFIGQLAVDAFKRSLSFAVGIITSGIHAASEFEESVNQLNIALASGGTFSKEASRGFQDFAQAIQETTKFSDDQVLSSAALLAQMTTLSNDGVKTATQAALDLSSAYRIDLDTATRLLGKSTEGNITGLQKLGFQIQKGSTDAQTYANVLKALAGINDASAKSANTYEGALIKLRNSFGDFLKEIGKTVTRSPALITAFKELSKLFSGFSEGLKLNKTDVFKDLIINFSVIAQAGIASAREIGLSFELAFLRAKQAWLGFKVLVTAGLSDAFNKSLMDVNDQIDQLKQAFGEDPAIIKFFDNLILKVTETKGVLRDLGEGIVNNPITTIAPTWTDAANGFFSAFDAGYTLVGQSAEFIAQKNSEASERMKADFKETGERAKTSFAGAVGQGFAAFGKALVTGENALGAFAKAMAGAIGAAAVQEGTAMMLRGFGYSIDPILSAFGPPLITAGAALATFGGALQAIAGGGKSGAGGGVAAGGGGGGGSTAEPATLTPEEDLLSRKKTEVTVNIQGNVLDRREAGLEIIQIINEAFDSQGAGVVARV